MEGAPGSVEFSRWSQTLKSSKSSVGAGGTLSGVRDGVGIGGWSGAGFSKGSELWAPILKVVHNSFVMVLSGLRSHTRGP